MTDEHCPYGTHCRLGVCNPLCADDDDCGGGRCDRFGRCRVPDDEGLAPAPALTEATRLRVTPSLLLLRPAAPPRPVKIATLSTSSGPIRVTAPEGVSVSCGDDVFGAECALSGLPAAGSRALRVRLDDGAPADATGTLRVFHGPDRYTVGLEARGAVGAGAVAGVYEGFARLARLGRPASWRPSSARPCFRACSVPSATGACTGPSSR